VLAAIRAVHHEPGRLDVINHTIAIMAAAAGYAMRQVQLSGRFFWPMAWTPAVALDDTSDQKMLAVCALSTWQMFIGCSVSVQSLLPQSAMALSAPWLA